jgi:polysaccharide export outer membrane protein
MTANCRSKNTDRWLGVLALIVLCSAITSAQAQKPVPTAQSTPTTAAAAVAAPRAGDPVVPPGYLIGTDDMLSIMFWKDRDMSTDVQVRPDGRIALPLLNEVQAAGLTPDQLRQQIMEESKKYIEDANITVVVRQINSRKVFITGEVNRPGPYPLTSATTVMQLIATAGGLREFANSKKIVIMRKENGKPISLAFNYKDVVSGKNLTQNIELKPGDTVVVP